MAGNVKLPHGVNESLLPSPIHAYFGVANSTRIGKVVGDTSAQQSFPLIMKMHYVCSLVLPYLPIGSPQATLISARLGRVEPEYRA